MGIGKDWTTDWASFIQDVAASFDRGLSDRAVTDQYAGRLVVWEGTIDARK